jgi:putative Holliday junction resolvase
MYESRVVGVDYGRKRIGLALSDPLRITAQPLPTLVLRSPQEAVNRVCEALSEYQVELLVIGRPGSLSGGGGQMADEVASFAAQLEKRGYRVLLVDERLSSQQARKTMRLGGKSEKQMRGKLDSIAAQLILQSYLDRTDS